MKKILILGKNGYVSSNFQQYMKNYDDYTIDVISSRNHTWEKVDFSKYDVVFNTSGLCHANAKKGSEDEYYTINGMMPVEIAEKAKSESVKQYISISSMIIYGDMSLIGEKHHVTENTKIKPKTVYGKSKRMAELGLEKLMDKSFKVVIIRPPMIYGETATENFPRLVRFAKKSPIFPNIRNSQSMIYIFNLCELIRLIIDNSSEGYFYPQEKEYIDVSNLVKDIANSANHKIWMTKIFNPVIRLSSKRINVINKVFGNLTYDKQLSGHFNWEYCKIPYLESVNNITEKIK